MKQKEATSKQCIDKEIQKELDIMLKNAYSPYSKGKVACVLHFKNGKIYGGCNIENASYSCTICAERCAIFKAVSAGEDLQGVDCVYIKCDQKQLFSPCGACRQVLSEFVKPETPIVMLTSQNEKLIEVQTLEKLLPLGFKL